MEFVSPIGVGRSLVSLASSLPERLASVTVVTIRSDRQVVLEKRSGWEGAPSLSRSLRQGWEGRRELQRCRFTRRALGRALLSALRLYRNIARAPAAASLLFNYTAEIKARIRDAPAASVRNGEAQGGVLRVAVDTGSGGRWGKG
jgi:hypothetical protein